MNRSALPDVIARTVQAIVRGSGSVLHQPEFAGNEWIYVKECLDTRWVSSVGRFVDRFEDQLAAYTGAARAVAVVNGTAALELCLRLVGVRPGDEVIVPALSFVATANAVRYCGAIPHFVDSARGTLGLDPNRLREYLIEIGERRASGFWNRRTGARIAGVVPMHTFGHPVDMDALMDVAESTGLTVVEDAAESLGSTYRGRHMGTFGRVAALSFNGNKIVTTGGGGAVLTTDAKLGARAKHLSTTARVTHRWALAHDELGYNYRLPNINAALGCAQLEQLDSFVARKRELARRYADAFQPVEGVSVFEEDPDARSNYWLNTLILDENVAAQRDAILEVTNDQGIATRPAWTLLHRLPMYRTCPRMTLPMAESLERRILNLPSSAALADAAFESV